jgi:transcriptional regulator with XRE-family HTH domain
MNNIQKLLLRNIKEGRKVLGYSQMKLAELCNVSTSFIGEIEIGRKFPSASTLQRICKALGMKPYELFLDSDDKGKLNRHELLTGLYRDLKDKVNADMEEVLREHLG